MLRAQRAVLALAVTGLVVFAASTVLRPPGSYLAWSDVGVYLVVQLACALVCALRGFGVRRPGRDGTGRRALQWPWLFIAAGLAMTTCGDLAYAVLISDGGEPPYPSVADWCYLAFFPAMYVGLLLLVAQRRAAVPGEHLVRRCGGRARLGRGRLGPGLRPAASRSAEGVRPRSS